MTTDTLLLRASGARRRKGHTLSADALRAEWIAVDRLKARSEKPLERAAQRLFRDQKRDVVARAEEVLPQVLVKSPFVVSMIFDLDKWKRITARLFAPLLSAAMRGGFDTGLLRASVTGFDFSTDVPAVQATLFDLLLKVKGINDTTADDLSRLIQAGVVEGKDAEAIAGDIAAQFTQYEGARARLIAEDAGGTAFEAGQQEAFDEAGIERKRWLTQRDGRVRESHAAADGQEVPVDGAFEIGGYLLKYPGDFSLGAPAR